MTLRDLQFDSTPTAPEGMILTVAGRLVPDNGYGQLIDLLDAAYELDDHVVVTLDNGTPEQFFIGDHVAANGSVKISAKLTVARDSSVEVTAITKSGECNSTTFTIDGHSANITWHDPIAAAEAA